LSISDREFSFYEINFIEVYRINTLDFNFMPEIKEVHNCCKIIDTETVKSYKLHDIY